MSVSRVRHTGFVVGDLKKSMDFYCGILGLTVYRREVEEGEYIEKLVGIKNVRVEWVKLNVPGGGLVELLQYHYHPDPDVFKKQENFPSNRLGCSHIALTVNNLAALHKTLIESGHSCNSEPLTS